MKEATSPAHTPFVRAIRALALMLLAGALGLALVACAPKTDAEVLREGISSELDPIKNLDSATLETILAGFTAEADLTSIGVDNAEFCKAVFAGFDYKIENVIIHDKEAKVETTFTAKDLMAAMADYQAKAVELVNSPAVSSMSIEELNRKKGALLMECMDAAPFKTVTIDLPCKLEGSTWKPTAGFYVALNSIFINEETPASAG
ncbi:MAG: hypothetical protein LBG81_03815 [Coriobacteriaceae bacterium]|nr:hypothetical protein [Coriobacteriaceae bacterium]